MTDKELKAAWKQSVKKDALWNDLYKGYENPIFAKERTISCSCGMKNSSDFGVKKFPADAKTMICEDDSGGKICLS